MTTNKKEMKSRSHACIEVYFFTGLDLMDGEKDGQKVNGPII